MDHHITYTHQRKKKRNKHGNTWVYTVKLLSSSGLSPSQPLESHPLSLVTTRLGLESVLPLGEVDVLLVLLLGDKVGLVLGQSSSDSPGLLVSEVEGKVLGVLALVQLPDVLPLLLVDDGQDSGDRLSDTVDLSELVGRSTGDLGDPQRSQLGLEFIELGEEVGLVLALQLEGTDLGGHLEKLLPFFGGRVVAEVKRNEEGSKAGMGAGWKILAGRGGRDRKSVV